MRPACISRCGLPRQGRTWRWSRKRLAETVSESASFWAQGGLAAAIASDDSPARHTRDTLDAGRGLCRTAAVEALVQKAPGAVAELVERGVGFDTEADGSLALALEGRR